MGGNACRAGLRSMAPFSQETSVLTLGSGLSWNPDPMIWREDPEAVVTLAPLSFLSRRQDCASDLMTLASCGAPAIAAKNSFLP